MPSGVTKYPIRHVGKEWGTEFWLVNERSYCAKLLIIKPGYTSSLHYHMVKDETFLVVDGKPYVELDGTQYMLHRGQGIRIPPMKNHRFWVPAGERKAKVLEVSTHHDDSDTVRISPSGKL